ncbi:hypothetical protein [Aquibacillus sediminis]|uniref:hypothetical protein n=1 Tax=Aquibacillus sediminis TaxID=2574734 RepID=UPI001109E21F|nr:hypothetical protein [Aquibacillus sediminis]
MRRVTFTFIAFVLLTIAFLALTGNFPPQLGIGNPTAKEILDGNPNADILQIDGVVYANVSDVDRFKERNNEVGEKIGEVKKQTDRTWWYRDFFATKLPVGTEIFVTKDQSYSDGDTPSVIIAQSEGNSFMYLAYVEG